VQDARKASWRLASLSVVSRDSSGWHETSSTRVIPPLFSLLLLLHSCAVTRLIASLVSKAIRSNRFRYLCLVTVGKITLAYLSYIIIFEGDNHVKLNDPRQLDRELFINRLKFFQKPVKDPRRCLSHERHDDQASHRREFDQDHVKHLCCPKRDGIRNLQSLSPSNLQCSTFTYLNS
jgi:hypothetical protein